MNEELTRIFGNVSIYLQFFLGVSIGLISCVMFSYGFGFIDRGRIWAGGGCVLFGFVLFVGDGLVITGCLW